MILPNPFLSKRKIQFFIKRNFLIKFVFLVLLSSPFYSENIYSQSSGIEAYNQGIDLLYNKNQPNEALTKFKMANELEPEQWSRPFMIGYTLKNYLQNPKEALSYLQKASELNNDLDEMPFKETIICLENLRKLDDAITYNLKFQNTIRGGNKNPSPWFQENLAWLYYTKGDTNKAIQYAPEGSWVQQQLAPKEIRIDWNIRLTKLLSSWRIQDGNTIRITLPLDRPYQKLISYKLTEPNSNLNTSEISKRGNRFLQLEKPNNEDWPEQIQLSLVIEQNAKSLTNRPAKLKASKLGDPNFDWASENREGLFSLDDPEFISQVNQITRSGRSLGEKADLALNYLRANYKYGTRVEGNSVKSWLDQGTGDCGYFTYIAIGMLRALKIPVRGVYGIGPWTDPSPALPHSILEIYDASKNQWFPHDPQSDQLFGVINPSYVAFTAGNPKQDAAVLAEDGVWELDSVWFFWNGSGADTINFQVQTKNQTSVASRSLTKTETKAPEYIKTVQSGGPPPVK
ncbi:MAG: transglutaminase domain-containing protein [Leptospira sp.]|nr:transglutaminase domain-containing protein [Leptospira sp.]